MSASARAGSVPGLVVLTVLLAVSVTLVAPGPIAAAPTRDSRLGVAPDPRPTSDARARHLLQRVAAAEDTVPYSGVQFVSAWSATGAASSLVEVQNVPGEGTALRVRGSAAGPAAAMFTGAPDARVGSSLNRGPIELLGQNYTLRYAGRADATGRPAQLVEMIGVGGEVAARFWVDKSTGLLLRRELYDSAGRTVRASAFAQLQVGRRAVPSHLPPVVQRQAATRLTTRQVSELQHRGWACPDTMAGTLTLYDTRRVELSTGTVLHLSYSDGLSTVSVFQQTGTIGEEGLDGYDRVRGPDGTRYVRSGIPQQVVWAAGDVVYSVVADAPPAVVDAVMADLPQPNAEQRGMLGRLGRGLDRVGSWVNPFA